MSTAVMSNMAFYERIQGAADLVRPKEARTQTREYRDTGSQDWLCLMLLFALLYTLLHAELDSLSFHRTKVL